MDKEQLKKRAEQWYMLEQEYRRIEKQRIALKTTMDDLALKQGELESSIGELLEDSDRVFIQVSKTEIVEIGLASEDMYIYLRTMDVVL